MVARLTVELKAEREDWQRIVKEFALHLCMTPAPLCGHLQLVSGGQRCIYDTINCICGMINCI